MSFVYFTQLYCKAGRIDVVSLHFHREQDEEAERKNSDERWDYRCLFLGLAGYTSRWMLKCAEINMRCTVFASRKARPEDADPPTKLKLMSFPVRGLSRPPVLLTRVRHSSSPLRRPRLLGN